MALSTFGITEAMHVAYLHGNAANQDMRSFDDENTTGWKDRIDMQSSHHWSDNDANSWTLKCVPYTFTRPQLAIYYMVP